MEKRARDAGWMELELSRGSAFSFTLPVRNSGSGS